MLDSVDSSQSILGWYYHDLVLVVHSQSDLNELAHLTVSRVASLATLPIVQAGSLHGLISRLSAQPVEWVGSPHGLTSRLTRSPHDLTSWLTSRLDKPAHRST